MTLIVSDAAGRRYQPTGQFREPKPGEHLYCFNHKRVERRPLPSTDYSAYGTWCSNAHVEFLLHRIICEPLPVEYEVTVTMTPGELDYYKSLDCNTAGRGAVRLGDAIRAGNYREVPQ